MSDLVSNWQFKNAHIDESISTDQFTTAQRTIIYASVENPRTRQPQTAFKRIGLLQGFSWGEQQQIDMLFELGSNRPYLVPGVTTGSLSLARILLSGKDLTNLLCGVDQNETDSSKIIRSLKDIYLPISMLFAAYSNANDSNGNVPLMFSRLFQGCRITSRSESVSAGQTVIAQNCTLMYEDIVDYKVEGY